MEALSQNQVILRPVLSEKSLLSYNKDRVCTFWVDSKATKKHILKNFKDVFGIEPKSINTVVSRKENNLRTVSRISKVRKMVKKAYINIGEESLDIFENIK